MKIKVLGVGSPFGDDQIGWRVVEALKQEKFLKKFIEKNAENKRRKFSLKFECLDRPGLMLIDNMQSADTVFIVDAMKSGLPAGTIRRFYNKEIKSAKGFLSTHSIGVIQVLELAKELEKLPAHVILYGIEIDCISNDFKLSQKAARAKTNAVKKLETELLEFIESGCIPIVC